MPEGPAESWVAEGEGGRQWGVCIRVCDGLLSLVPSASDVKPIQLLEEIQVQCQAGLFQEEGEAIGMPEGTLWLFG